MCVCMCVGAEIFFLMNRKYITCGRIKKHVYMYVCMYVCMYIYISNEKKCSYIRYEKKTFLIFMHAESCTLDVIML